VEISTTVRDSQNRRCSKIAPIEVLATVYRTEPPTQSRTDAQELGGEIRIPYGLQVLFAIELRQIRIEAISSGACFHSDNGALPGLQAADSVGGQWPNWNRASSLSGDIPDRNPSAVVL